MGTIVVGIEDSSRGQDAVALASELARASGAPVLALCADPYDDRPEAHYNPAWLEAVRLAANGDTCLNPRIGAAIATAPMHPVSRPDDLSAREVEVLHLIALGFTNAEIAQKLFLSTRTVETHRAHIQQKLQRTSRAALVRYALDHRLVEV